MSSSNVMVSIAEFLIGHSSHGAVLLRYLRDLNFGKNEFLRKHKVHVCLLRFIVYNHVTVSYCSMAIQLKPLLRVRVYLICTCYALFFLLKNVFFSFIICITVLWLLQLPPFCFLCLKKKIRCERNYWERGGKLICVASIVFLCAHYVTKEQHLMVIFITKFCFLCVLCLQEQASIGCHTPICTISQTKLEVCGMLVMFIVIF